MARHIPLDKQIANLMKKHSNNKSNLKIGKNETIESLLEKQAKRLIQIMKEELQTAIYSNPESRWYKRSGDLMNSIDENIKVDKKTNTIRIGFLEDRAWHDSWITKTSDPSYNKRAFVPQGVIEGYEVFNSGYKIEGVDWIGNAVERFNKEKRNGITVKINRPPEGTWWE
jgi:hypothetical protein